MKRLLDIITEPDNNIIDMAARCEEVIITGEKRGKGTEDDPVRYVLQVYAKDGKLIAENDPIEPPKAQRTPPAHRMTDKTFEP